METYLGRSSRRTKFLPWPTGMKAAYLGATSRFGHGSVMENRHGGVTGLDAEPRRFAPRMCR